MEALRTGTKRCRSLPPPHLLRAAIHPRSYPPLARKLSGSPPFPATTSRHHFSTSCPRKGSETPDTDEGSPYDLFPGTLSRGPPPHGPFRIDTSALRTEFRRLQARVHPDTQPQSRRVQAEAASSWLNHAFRTLADPLARAQYLLGRHAGIDVAADESARVTDPALLDDVMCAQEEIEAAANEADLEPTRARNDARIARCEDALEAAFAESDYARAQRLTVELKYWTNVRRVLDNWEEGAANHPTH